MSRPTIGPPEPGRSQTVETRPAGTGQSRGNRAAVDEVDRAWELRRELGRKLKACCKAAGLSQRQLASRTIGYTTVRKPAAPAAPEAPAR